MSEETAGKTADQSVDLQHMPELVIVTGMSGAGRTEAMHSFEDLGYFCVDNLPSSLIGNLLELTGMPGQPDEKRRLAVVCDARNRDFFASLAGELKKLAALLITSYGACIFCTAIPLSITFISRLAKIYAIVPPPPASTFPSSAIWKYTSASSITFLNFPMNSAEASLEPLFPLEPVYLLNTIPFPKNAEFFFSNTDA